MSFNKIIYKVIEHEGGYVNDKDDLGGETNYGITKRFYPNLDIENLDLDNNEDNVEDDTVLIEDESDIDPAVDVGIKPTEDNEEEY